MLVIDGALRKEGQEFITKTAHYQSMRTDVPDGLAYAFSKVEFVGGSFLFFQAEDGILDPLVTGVQTCALPICRQLAGAARPARVAAEPGTAPGRLRGL